MVRKIVLALAASQFLIWSDTGIAQTVPPQPQAKKRITAPQIKARKRVRVAQTRQKPSTKARTAAPQIGEQTKLDANAGTVTVMTTRNLGAPFMRAALDLSTLLDDGERFEKMRVIPLVARGKVQNLWDILYLKGIDMGFVQTDALKFLKDDPRIQSIKRRIRFVTVMFPAEVHIVARKDIRSLKDLAGKKVSINAKGTGSSVVGTVLFKALGIKALVEHEDTGRAIARMKRGELAAHFNVLGKPARPVLRIKNDGKLHLLPIPYSKSLQDVYLPSKFTHKDYPNLIPEGQTIPTLAAGNVLAVFNWPKGTARYKKVARFVEAFFSRFEELKKPGFHPKWREVNLAAKVPGWKRFPAAQQWLDKNLPRRLAKNRGKDNKLKQDFLAFMKANGVVTTRANSREMQALFNQFLRWRSAQR